MIVTWYSREKIQNVGLILQIKVSKLEERLVKCKKATWFVSYLGQSRSYKSIMYRTVDSCGSPIKYDSEANATHNKKGIKALLHIHQL